MMVASQFNLLTLLGLKSHHNLLDFGCGSLRVGKCLIPYLNTGRYWGIEPNEWLINEAIKNELGEDMLKIKKPKFIFDDGFDYQFNSKFDYIIAQSIFSHTNLKLFSKGLANLYECLENDGIFLFTASISKKNYDKNEEWLYPGVAKYKKQTLFNLFNKRLKFWKKLNWYHPTQTWFIATKNKKKIPSFFKNLFLGINFVNKYI